MTKKKKQQQNGEAPTSPRFHRYDPLLAPQPAAEQFKSKAAFSLCRPIAPLEAESHDHLPSRSNAAESSSPRGYQKVLFQQSLQENTIVYLETGCGKTLIAVLLIKELCSLRRAKREKFSAVFLAPTVHLVNQQAEVMKINTDLQVDSFYGAKKVDYWSASDWKSEFDQNEVLVMTPMVLLDALRHGFLKMESFDLIIFDECHRAQKQHPYAKIMTEFYHRMLDQKKPKIFGMTASPVTNKGISSSEDSAKQIQQLETLLDCKVFTLEDKTEVERFAPTPIQTCKWYELSPQLFDNVIHSLNCGLKKYEDHYTSMLENNSLFKDVKEMSKKLLQKVKKMHNALTYSLEELGLWCARESAKFLLKNMKNELVENDVVCDSKQVRNTIESFLTEALRAICEAMNRISSDPQVSSHDDCLASVKSGLLTSKVVLLVENLLEYKDAEVLRCLVFVDRVITATVLAEILQRIECISFVRCGYLSGTTASLDVMGKQDQQSALQAFKSGRINVLIATDVAEEGLDIQSCSSVIRFDLPKTVRSYIQSRGRARRPNSDFILFLEKNSQRHADLLAELMQSEVSMRDGAINRTHLSITIEKKPDIDAEVLHIEGTGATINLDSSVNVINRFCSKLPGDKYYNPVAEFLHETIDGEGVMHVCRLIMPSNGPFREMIGPPRRNKSLAKQSVCLEACKKLCEMGQMTEHLTPVVEVCKEDAEEKVMNVLGKNVAGAGTTKRKELHCTALIEAFAGDWINSSENLVLYAYVICFTSTEREARYADFALLFNAIIDDNMLKSEISLHLTKDRIVTTRIYSGGTYSLSPDQLKDAKTYQQLIFNGMFGKLVRRLRKKDCSSAHESEMYNLLSSQNMLDETWNPLCTFLLLPLSLDKVASDFHGIPIDWEAISNAARAASVFSDIFAVRSSNQTSSENTSLDESDILRRENLLQMACKTTTREMVQGMAVITYHTGRIYSVTDVLEDINANSPIQGADVSLNYKSYAHYFAEKYNLFLKYPLQPLLEVKHSHRIHNLLTKVSLKDKAKGEKQNQRAQIPPELCILTGISNAVIQSLYLLPSVLHRLNALISAAELRNKIAKEIPGCFCIDPSLVMEALTTQRCLESFSSEGLELLGDSFLKYAASRYLYLVYDKKHEGQLTVRRCRIICNETLHKLAMKRQLAGYIRDQPFQPDYWHVPGMLCTQSIQCKCNLANLACRQSECHTEDKKRNKVFKIGKSCNKGHRWICSKSVSDAVEALIGAFVVNGGAGAALGFMKWIGFEIDFDQSLFEVARNRCHIQETDLPKMSISGVEAEIGYEFFNKSLLVEALTHASHHDPNGGWCYQRLEFLGDAVLDFLITRHLFSVHAGLSPGVLSDLRSAAVNNSCFARAIVKHNLQRYLRHASSELLSQITNFVRATQTSGKQGDVQMFGWEGVEGPKVLGDLFESIAGAILVDSGFDINVVWSVMERLLSPLVTPLTLPLHPIREFHELSQLRQIPFQWKKVERKGVMATAAVEVWVGSERFTKTGSAKVKQVARKYAAQEALSLLMSRGIIHPLRLEQSRAKGGTLISDIDCMHTLQDGQGNHPKDNVTHGCEESHNANNENSPKDENEAQALNKHVNGGGSDEIWDIPSSNDSGKITVPRNDAFDGGEVDPEETKEGGSSDMTTAKVGSLRDDKTLLPEKRACNDTESSPHNKRIKPSCDANASIKLDMRPLKADTGISDPGDVIEVTFADANESSYAKEERELMGKAALNLRYHVESNLSTKGCGRALLNEFCARHKWTGPKYELVPQDDSRGQGPPSLFRFSASIHGPLGIIKLMGDPMPRKDQAKDNVAAKILITLSQTFST